MELSFTSWLICIVVTWERQMLDGGLTGTICRMTDRGGPHPTSVDEAGRFLQQCPDFATKTATSTT
jgi:hypothetical protein